MVFLALTGAGFVLRPHLEDLVYGNLHLVPKCEAPQPLDKLAAIAKAAHPQGKLHSIEFTAENTSSVAVMFTDKDYVFIDPCQGKVLGVQNQYGGFFGLMDWLHRFRFFTDLKLGRTVAGWANTAFLVLLIGGGIALWWPRNRQALKTALKFNARLPGSARTLSLHKVVGVYTALVLVLITVTALPIGFEPVKELLYSATGYVPPKKPLSKAAPEGTAPQSMEAFWQKTRAAAPEWDWVSLRYPPKSDASYEAEILEKDRPHELAKGHYYMDAFSGETLKQDGYLTDQQIGRKIYLYCIVLHAGMVWGLPYQLLLLACALGVGVQAYSGFSPYLRRTFRKSVKPRLELKLVKKTVEADGICSFEFADLKGEALPMFSAGAHVDVYLPSGLVRQYSLCNDPSETHRYQICVLRHAASRGGSQAMHELLLEGDTVSLGLPKNHFPLESGAKHSVLIAGGIGITPLLSMAHQLSSKGADFTLHYCARSRQRSPFLDAIANSKFSDRVVFHFSDDPNSKKFDVSKDLRQFSPESHLYVCGPVRFMEATLAGAHQQGWPEGNLHREYFSGVQSDSTSNVAFDIKLASSGRIVHVSKESTVMAALAACGVEIASSCSEGVCGTCLTRVLGGEVDHRDRFLTAQERAAQDRFTPCCSRARGSMLVLDI